VIEVVVMKCVPSAHLNIAFQILFLELYEPPIYGVSWDGGEISDFNSNERVHCMVQCWSLTIKLYEMISIMFQFWRN
jgi:hypothetical protein